MRWKISCQTLSLHFYQQFFDKDQKSCVFFYFLSKNFFSGDVKSNSCQKVNHNTVYVLGKVVGKSANLYIF